MSNNDDPIKENNPIRIGLDNLTEDDDYNSDMEYNDLHDCSDDLSDRGSRVEEIAHAKFAEQQRRKQYGNYYSSSWQGNGNVVIAKSAKRLIVFAIVCYIIFQIIGATLVGIFSFISEMDFDTQSSMEAVPNYDYEYTDVDNDYNDHIKFNDIETDTTASYTIPEYTPEVELTKNNIHITSGLSEYGDTLIVQIDNQNNLSMYNYTIQVIFYDAEDKPMEITDVSIYELPANKVQTQEIFNLPEYSRYDIYMPVRNDEQIPYAYQYK